MQPKFGTTALVVQSLLDPRQQSLDAGVHGRGVHLAANRRSTTCQTYHDCPLPLIMTKLKVN